MGAHCAVRIGSNRLDCRYMMWLVSCRVMPATVLGEHQDADRPMRAADAPFAGGASRRLLYIDNLRWTMIVLVVTLHAAVTYSGMGSWYYKEPVKPGPAALLFFVFF